MRATTSRPPVKAHVTRRRMAAQSQVNWLDLMTTEIIPITKQESGRGHKKKNHPQQGAEG